MKNLIKILAISSILFQNFAMQKTVSLKSKNTKIFKNNKLTSSKRNFSDIKTNLNQESKSLQLYKQNKTLKTNNKLSLEKFLKINSYLLKKHDAIWKQIIEVAPTGLIKDAEDNFENKFWPERLGKFKEFENNGTLLQNEEILEMANEVLDDLFIDKSKVKIFDEYLRMLGDPNKKNLEFAQLSTLGSLAMSQRNYIFIQPHLLSKRLVSCIAKKYVIAHELFHWINDDLKKNHLLNFIYIKNLFPGDIYSKYLRFGEMRADIKAGMISREYAQGACDQFEAEIRSENEHLAEIAKLMNEDPQEYKISKTMDPILLSMLRHPPRMERSAYMKALLGCYDGKEFDYQESEGMY